MVVRAYTVCIGVTPECRRTESEMVGGVRMRRTRHTMTPGPMEGASELSFHSLYLSLLLFCLSSLVCWSNYMYLSSVVCVQGVSLQEIPNMRSGRGGPLGGVKSYFC